PQNHPNTQTQTQTSTQLPQNNHLKNFIPISILQSQNSILTNKYTKKYPNHHYYNKYKKINITKKLTIQHTKTLFNTKFTNIQPQ
ncbi:hypothetical protein DF186_19995, partial [Enterococcus hirae]